MLQLENITHFFAGHCSPVLKNIQFSLNPGDFCIVIGANGSGKSTLFKIISGEYLPTNGKVNTNARHIAQVSQDVNQGTIPEMTLLENMVLSQMSLKKSKIAFYKRYADQILETIKAFHVELENKLHQPLSTLSGGQRQLIAVLMALISKPNILLLDEHTSALDPHMQRSVMKITAKAIEKNQITTLMVTHQMEDAIRYGNRIILLHGGQIVRDISGEEKLTLSLSDLRSMMESYHEH